MKQEIEIGTTDYTALILIRDTDGAPKTGLTNASAGIDVCYTRTETDNDVVLTAGAPVALATPALTDPHLDWGFLEVDSTNAPGLYRLDLPDGVFASGAWTAVVSLIATDIDPTQVEYILVAVDKLDGVRMGLTALPDAAADAAGGLPISDAGGLDLDDLLTTTELSSAFTEIKGATWASSTDTLEAIRDSITDANPQNHAASANNETTGTLDSGTYVDTMSENTTYYQVSPVTPAVDGFGLNVDLTFNIGSGRVCEQLEVIGYFDSGAQRTVQVWAYDYTISDYVQLSSSTNDFGNSGSNDTYQYPMTNNMRQASDGEVNIRFTSTSTTTGDDFYCDAVSLSSVAQSAAGLTADAIQQAVWARLSSGHDESTLGYNASKLFIKHGHIVSGSDAKTFVIDYDLPTDIDMKGMLIMIEDKTDDRYEIRRIVSTISASDTVIVDRNFSFTPEALDDWYFLGQGYTDASATEVKQDAIISQLSDIETDTTEIANIPTTAEFEARSLPSADYIETSDISNTVIEGTVTLQQALMIMLSALAGESDGAMTATQHFRNTIDTKNRITATVDSLGNRTSITLDLT